MLAATRRKTDSLAILAGLVLAALLVLGWRVEGGVQVPAAELEVVTGTSSDLALSPAGVTTDQARLSPSATEEGLVRELGVRNATGDTLAVRATATRATGDLDQAVSVRILVAGQKVFEGKLGELLQGSEPFTLASHEETRLWIQAWISESEPSDGWAGRGDTVQIDLVTEKR
jgi:hypothetical protein